MNSLVFGAVLLAAAMHAGWNSLVKVSLDRTLSLTLVALSSGLAAGFLLPFFDLPGAASWPWLLLSVVLHMGYLLFLGQAYRAGDLGQVYPIARGAAPLLVAVPGVIFFGEVPGMVSALGVGMLIGGVCVMALCGGRGVTGLDRRGLGFALGTSLFIASYTLTDAVGARSSGSPHGYALWLFVLYGWGMLALLLFRQGTAALRPLLGHWRAGLAGGVLSFAAYWIVIWGMTVAPVAPVAALRETSVLFAVAISVFLGEPLTRWRSAAALLIVAGIVMVRLG